MRVGPNERKEGKGMWRFAALADARNPGYYSGVMMRRESSEDVGYILCANFKREPTLFSRSFIRRSTSFPTGSLTCRM